MLTRRLFMVLTSGALWQSHGDARAQGLPECEWCGADEAPPALKSAIRLAGDREPGQPLHLRGTVYAPDGVTPAPGILLYLYHTNNAGRYAQRGDETGNGLRHGYLRGWLVSDDHGNFEVRTILPGFYPNRASPRHIHMTVKEPDRPEYWIDSVLFEGDPLIKPNAQNGRGGPGIVKLSRAGENLMARRDVVLWRPG